MIGVALAAAGLLVRELGGPANADAIASVLIGILLGATAVGLAHPLASGYIPLHDEAAIYERERGRARQGAPTGQGDIDWYSFTVAFKGVFLEGLEVAFIVVTFGTARHHGIALATAAAATALVVVAVVGVVARAPLSRVPENVRTLRRRRAAVGLPHQAAEDAA